MMTFTFDNVSPAAFVRLIEAVRHNGVEFFFSESAKETLGTFRSEAGSGTFAHVGDKLTVTIVRNEGHFSNLMIKGGLRQLVSEAQELRRLEA